MSKNARKSKTRSKAKVRSKKVGAHGKVDRRRTVQHRGKTLFLLKGGSEINPCAGKEDGTSCGAGCVCRGGQMYYTVAQLAKRGHIV
jgi:hypothetical protein